MSTTFISPVITRASQLGVSLSEDSDRVELYPNSSTEDLVLIFHLQVVVMVVSPILVN